MKFLEAVSKLNSKFGVGTVADFQGKDITDFPHISTGITVIDYVTGIGGFPRGRITELHGMHASYKTTSALLAAIQCQKLGQPVLYLDFENSFDPSYFVDLGGSLDPALFALVQPRTMQDGFRIAQFFNGDGTTEQQGVPDLGMVIIDSVAAMATAQDIGHEVGDTQVGTQAQVMSVSLRQLKYSIGHSNVAWVFINQLRSLIDLSFGGQQRTKMLGPQYETAGGRALKFYADLRLEFMPAGFEKEERVSVLSGEKEKQTTGSKIRVTAVKNKCAAPFKKGEFLIQHGFGVRGSNTDVALAVNLEVIVEQSKGMFLLKPPLTDMLEETVRGIPALQDYFDGHPEKLAFLKKEVWAALCQKEN